MASARNNSKWKEDVKLPFDFENRFSLYKEKVSRANNEATIGFNFLKFATEVFENINADYAYKKEPKLEKYVKVKEGTILVKGRIDALLGNVIIEFKDSLTESKIEDAENQIKKYIFALRQRYYNCIISDGLTFRAYQPRFIEGKLDLEAIVIEKIDEINIESSESEEIYLWFDRYFLTGTLLIPNTEEFSKEFGSNSPIFRRSMGILKDIWSDVNKKFEILYKEWSKYLRIVYGSSIDSEELFLKHTYLATLSKLMVFMFYSKGVVPSSEKIKKILDGSAFKELGIINFLDEDFFAWVSKENDGIEFCKDLIIQLCRYDLTKINEDILKGLYQELVDPRDRHDLGEYYTPDWLADYIVNTMMKNKPKAKVLDPACGSGTFLVFTIQFKKKKLNHSTDPSKILQHITNSVVGIDVHPLALIIARSNYIMALGNLIREGRKGTVVIPVYLADSMKIPEKEKEITTTKLDLYRKEVEKNIYLKIPAFISSIKRRGSSANITDEIIEIVKDYSMSIVKRNDKESKEEFKSFLFSQIPEMNNLLKKDKKLGDEIIDVFFDTSKNMIKLIKENKDTIWAFILKNFYKPVLFKERFDVVVGNPPWLSYRYVKSTEYQEFLKKLISERYGLTSKSELITQMELATLFYIRASEIYLNKNGEIGFVMPRGIFDGDQHDAFRKGKYKINLNIYKIIDLVKVNPLFNIPSCVIFGKKGEKSKSSFEGELIEGKLLRKNESFYEAKNKLKFIKQKLFLNTIGDRSFISNKKIKFETGIKSYYYKKFENGATLYPRQLCFVDIKEHEKFGVNPQNPYVVSSKRAIKNAKKQYKDVKIEGNIEKSFIYGVLTGSELVPFGHLSLELVVLPVDVINNQFTILDVNDAKRFGKKYLFEWLSKSEKIWKSKRGEKSKKYDFVNQLNYRNKICIQNPNVKFKVIYNMVGTYLVSCLVELNELKNKNTRSFLSDYSTFYFETENKKEALYITSILNSRIIDNIIKPMQTKGQFGPRNIVKKPLEIPIPKFNPSKKDHIRLYKLGEICQKKVKNNLPDLTKKYDNIGKIRSEIKKIISNEIDEIDIIVEKILTQTKSKNLFDFGKNERKNKMSVLRQI